MRSQNTPGTFSSLRPKKSFTWVLAIRMAMPLVKPITIGRGMYFTADAHAGEPHDDENDPGHHRTHEQAVNAMRGHNAGDYDHKGTGWATDLGRRAAERGDEKARDHGAVNAGLRRESRGDGKRHGQRQRHQPHGDSGH